LFSSCLLLPFASSCLKLLPPPPFSPEGDTKTKKAAFRRRWKEKQPGASDHWNVAGKNSEQPNASFLLSSSSSPPVTESRLEHSVFHHAQHQYQLINIPPSNTILHPENAIEKSRLRLVGHIRVGFSSRGFQPGPFLGVL
jgi:hypothetical protein